MIPTLMQGLNEQDMAGVVKTYDLKPVAYFEVVPLGYLVGYGGAGGGFRYFCRLDEVVNARFVGGNNGTFTKGNAGDKVGVTGT